MIWNAILLNLLITFVQPQMTQAPNEPNTTSKTQGDADNIIVTDTIFPKQ